MHENLKEFLEKIKNLRLAKLLFDKKSNGKDTKYSPRFTCDMANQCILSSSECNWYCEAYKEKKIFNSTDPNYQERYFDDEKLVYTKPKRHKEINLKDIN